MLQVKKITTLTSPKTPFGILVRNIRIQAYKSSKLLKKPQETMAPPIGKFYKQKWVSQGPAVKPILPLIKEKSDDKDNDKTQFISMEVRQKAEGGKSTNKKYLRIFEEDTP